MMTFFYNKLTAAGAVGQFDSTTFTTTKVFKEKSFGNWSHIIKFPSATLLPPKEHTLLCYNSESGAGAIGTVSKESFLALKDYAPGSFGTWTHIVEGDTIWAKSGDGAKSPVTHKPLPTFAEDGAHLLFYDLVSGKGALGELRKGAFKTTKHFNKEAFGKWTQVANCTADLASTTKLTDVALRALVAKRIQTEYRRRGGNFAAGLLGAPVGAITQMATGAYVQHYQFGQIQQPMTMKSLVTNDLDLPLTQSDYVADIFLAAIKCFGTEDDGFVGIGGNGDEPYFIATSINPAPPWLGGAANGVVQTVRTEIFEHITVGSIFAEERLLFANVPFGAYGIQLKLALFEHESGDPEDLRRRIQEQGEALAKELIDLVAAMMGLTIDEAVADQALDSTLGKLVQDVTFDLITDWLKDDKIDEKNVLISAAMLKDWYDNGKTVTSDIPNQDLPSHIRFNFPRNFEDPYWVFSGGGGSYKVYLRVIPKQITTTAKKIVS